MRKFSGKLFLGYVMLLAGLLIAPMALSASSPEKSAVPANQANEESKAEAINTDSFESEDKSSESRTDESSSAETSESGLDWHKASVDSQVLRASQWVDGFFDDPNNLAESTSTQFRIRPEYYYRQEQGSKFKFKASVKIRLPRKGGRVSFIAGADENNEGSGDAGDEDDDESIIGLQFFLKDSIKWNASITAGVKFNDFAGLVGPRFRYLTAMGENSSMRFTQTFRWQTNNYWDIGSRLDLNFVLSDRFFFRQTVYGRWRGEESDEKGYRTRLSSVLSQKLTYTAGLQYDFSTIFHTKPDNHVDKYTLALRYRKRTSREWLYYEIVPQVSFEDKYDYDANLGIRLRVEMFFGGNKTSDFWKRTAEDDDDFRW
ncbi:MAG: hypothetical protein QNK22_03465 [Xanthomonadales bacterium]|nr:hypothetical protein [Xanthomonadales bacterium]